MRALPHCGRRLYEVVMHCIFQASEALANSIDCQVSCVLLCLSSVLWAKKNQKKHVFFGFFWFFFKGCEVSLVLFISLSDLCVAAGGVTAVWNMGWQQL